jgi:hypothetical protein
MTGSSNGTGESNAEYFNIFSFVAILTILTIIVTSSTIHQHGYPQEVRHGHYMDLTVRLMVPVGYPSLGQVRIPTQMNYNENIVVHTFLFLNIFFIVKCNGAITRSLVL